MLNPTLLEDKLKEFLFNSSPPADAAACAEGWAEAYKLYAVDGQSCAGGNPVGGSLTAAKATLKATLTPILNVILHPNDPSTVASGLAAAFTAFWLTPPVVFTSAGTVTTVSGTAALQTALNAFWTAGGAYPSADVAAAAHANILNIFTHTVFVTHGGCSGNII